jgi:hypothetical protein
VLGEKGGENKWVVPREGGKEKLESKREGRKLLIA